MEKKNTHILRLVRIVLGLTTLVSLIVLVFGLVSQWNTPVQFSNGFFIAGVLVIVLGLVSVAGGYDQRAEFNILYAQTMGESSLAERTQRMMAEIDQRYGTMIILVGVGILLIGVSVVIGQFS
jgi:hypothetical protein